MLYAVMVGINAYAFTLHGLRTSPNVGIKLDQRACAVATPNIIMKAEQTSNQWFGPAFEGPAAEAEMPETAADVYEVDVTEAAEAIVEDLEEDMEIPAAPATPKVKVPEIKLPEVKVNSEAIEDAAIGVFKFVRGAVQGVVNINKEYDIIGKAKGAAAAAVEFEKQNEVLLKTRAAIEVGAEGMKAAAKPTKPVVAKAEKPKPKSKATFEMPSFEMPKKAATKRQAKKNGKKA